MTVCFSQGYTIRSSVSWAVTNDVVDEELDPHSDETPDVLVDNIGIWKQAYPSVYRDGPDKKTEQGSKSEDLSSASRVFSYRIAELKVPSSIPTPPPHEETARMARYMAHYSDWGYLATISTQEKVILYLFWCFDLKQCGRSRSRRSVYFGLNKYFKRVLIKRLKRNVVP